MTLIYSQHTHTYIHTYIYIYPFKKHFNVICLYFLLFFIILLNLSFLLQFGHQTWPAHQYIVAHHSNFFKKILIEASKNETTSDLVISVGYIHSDLIKQLFQFFYTDTCDLVTPGASFLWTKKEKKCIDFDYFSHPSCKDFSILAELNYFGPRSKDDDPISLLISIADKFEIRRLTNK